jgi:hypothetical protein
VVRGLVEDRLSVLEREAAEACLGGIAPSKRHNVYDAIGIGLWHLRRWPK